MLMSALLLTGCCAAHSKQHWENDRQRQLPGITCSRPGNRKVLGPSYRLATRICVSNQSSSIPTKKDRRRRKKLMRVS